MDHFDILCETQICGKAVAKMLRKVLRILKFTLIEVMIVHIHYTMGRIVFRLLHCSTRTAKVFNITLHLSFAIVFGSNMPKKFLVL